MYPDRPPQPQRHRLIGAATLLGLAVLLAVAQGWRGNQQRDRRLERAWQTLAALDGAAPADRRALMQQAQAHFQHSAAVVSLEPQALIGVAVCEGLQAHWGAPLPLPPAASSCSDEQAAEWLRGALQRGQPRQALQWAADPAIARRGGLRPLLRFAEGWLRASDQARQPARD